MILVNTVHTESISVWTVFFMRKFCVRILICLVLVGFVWFGTVLADRQKLREELIRIHVVANSNTPEDQSIKLTVRDAVVDSLRQDLQNISDVNLARDYLRDKLPCIQRVANRTLQSLGCDETVTVSLKQEAFENTCNALFSLPAGIYESLRITIGSGQGENWWSILFPEALLSGSSAQGILPVFSESIEKGQNIEIRFWLLDVLGKIENIFIAG